MKKTLVISTAILGILMSVGGIFCIASPVSTFAALSRLVGAMVIIVGISQILHFAAGHDARSTWSLVSGILGILLGVLMIGNFYGRFLTSIVLTTFIAVWMFIHSIDDMHRAIIMKKLNETLPDESRSAFWLFQMIIGILTMILGILCMINPIFSMISAGLIIGFSILFAGIQNILLSILIHRMNIEVETYEFSTEC